MIHILLSVLLVIFLVVRGNQVQSLKLEVAELRAQIEELR